MTDEQNFPSSALSAHGCAARRFDALTYISASNANYTVCTNPRDPNDFSTCADPTVPATRFALNPATCGADCKYARRYCELVELTDASIAAITVSIEMPVQPRAPFPTDCPATSPRSSRAPSAARLGVAPPLPAA